MKITIRTLPDYNKKHGVFAYICIEPDGGIPMSSGEIGRSLSVTARKKQAKTTTVFVLSKGNDSHYFSWPYCCNNHKQISRMHINTAIQYRTALNRVFKRGRLNPSKSTMTSECYVLMLLTTVRVRLRAAITKARKEKRTYITTI